MWLKDCNTEKTMKKKIGVIVWSKLKDRWIISCWTYSWISWNSNRSAPWVDFEIISVAYTLSFVFKTTSEIWNSIPLFTALSQSDYRYLSFQLVVKHIQFSCSSFHIAALAFMKEFWGNLVGSFQLFLPLLFFKPFPILHQDLWCCWQFAWNGELETQQRDINKK